MCEDTICGWVELDVLLQVLPETYSGKDATISLPVAEELKRVIVNKDWNEVRVYLKNATSGLIGPVSQGSRLIHCIIKDSPSAFYTTLVSRLRDFYFDL